MNPTGARTTAGRTSLAIAAWVLALAGCAQMTETDCKAADWYQVGYRDGDVYGIQPQFHRYAYQCRAVDVQAAEPTYMAGWVDGNREWATRVMRDGTSPP